MQQTLEVLAGTASPTTITLPRGRWLWRLGIPLAIVVGALSILAFANRDHLLPRLPVRAVPVAIAVATAADESSSAAGSVAAATISVQAPGWVEPDPHPIFVSALADGIVEELLVLEGDRVEPGQVVARLVSEDAHLQVARAEAVLERRKALLAAAETEWREPVELERALAVSTAALEEAGSLQVVLQAERAKQSAQAAEAKTVYESLRPLSGDAASKLEVETARFKWQAQRAGAEAAEARLDLTAAQIERLEAEAHAARRHLHLRVDQKRRLAESRAAVSEAEVQLREARLRLTRMAVVSPAAGTVMDRLVAPGAKVMQRMDGPTSAHIVHLYDPERLQVRVDVPLVDAARIRPAQEARIVVDVLPDQEFSGRVTRFVHQADISKNTVQVKVAVDRPSAHVKPDMLARVKFLVRTEHAHGADHAAHAGGLRVFVPPEALVDGASTAWVVDAAGERVHRRAVVAGAGRRMGWLEVLEGLHAGDVVVAAPPDGLADGRRVRIVTEETMP